MPNICKDPFDAIHQKKKSFREKREQRMNSIKRRSKTYDDLEFFENLNVMKHTHADCQVETE